MRQILESSYFITEDGKVINKSSDRELKQKKTKLGYKMVCLYINKKKRYLFVHRLVAFAFLDNPDSYPEVNHLDGDKCNNVYSNLEWCNRSMNALHAHRTGLQATTILVGKDNGMYQGIIRAKSLITGAEFDIRALTECSAFGFNCGRVSQVIRGKEKAHKSHIFWRK
jgi:hypothetical protein